MPKFSRLQGDLRPRSRKTRRKEANGKQPRNQMQKKEDAHLGGERQKGTCHMKEINYARRNRAMESKRSILDIS